MLTDYYDLLSSWNGLLKANISGMVFVYYYGFAALLVAVYIGWNEQFRKEFKYKPDEDQIGMIFGSTLLFFAVPFLLWLVVTGALLSAPLLIPLSLGFYVSKFTKMKYKKHYRRVGDPL